MSKRHKGELANEMPNDPAPNIEDLGTGDDSGFASISESVGAAAKQASPPDGSHEAETGAADSAFKAAMTSEREPETENTSKHLATKEYNKEVEEQRYKRLMHLLDRSQFYSSYLVQKIDESLVKGGKKLGDGKRKPAAVSNENSPPKKKSKKVKEDKLMYDITKYVDVKDMRTRTSKKVLNLSQEEIANELLDSLEEKNPARKAQPVQLKYFNGKLRDYQIEGLKWLTVLYENGVNGILADEMGLGKTIQVIALICHLVEKRIPGPYLIIVPLSTTPNWLMEFERFAPKIPVVFFHGTSEERRKLFNKIEKKMHNVDGYMTQPVVLTTYETPMNEPRFIIRQQWRYLIIDEGHRVKNYKCQLLQLLKQCRSMNRLLLTGTPLQNNLSELWSLLNFLLPEIFNDLEVFESWFDAQDLQNEKGTERILKQEAEKKVLLSLREILKPFMLRRVKSDVCLDIPAKKEIVVYAPLSELQHNLYKAVLTRDLDTISKIGKESVILPEVDGQRPKRKCRNKIDLSIYMEDNTSEESSFRSSTPNYDNEEDSESSRGTWKNEQPVVNEKALSIWKQYTNVNERNKDYLVRIKMGNRIIMYKKIVNHPYLVHCPLNDVGLPRIDEELVKSSGKFLVLDAMLAKLKARGHKVLLFSTMTTILDVIEDYLELRPQYRYVRLDGASDIESRKTNIEAFNSNKDIFLFLISTRAGGVGLNLTGADTVIVFDSDWNPQADIQAMARCHRIGQTRPVVVYKLCTKGTIDEAIISRAEAKRKLEKMFISNEALRMNVSNGDTLIKLKQLLESSENQIVKSENDVLTPEDLDAILDRSDLMSKPKSKASAK